LAEISTPVNEAINEACRVGGSAGLVVSREFHDAVAARVANEFLDAPTCLGFDPVLVMTGGGELPGWLGLEGLVPPPLGAFAGGPGARWDIGRGMVGRTGERSWTESSAGAVGNEEIVCGSGDGDAAAVVQPVVVGADQYQVGQLGQSAVFPVPDVVCV
jgi:hypothetical protein